MGSTSYSKIRLRRGQVEVFEEYSGRALTECIRRAGDVFLRPVAWKKLVQAGMRQDFSWDKSAREYEDLYETLALKR